MNESNQRPFAGQAAIVTGAASGIGRAIALRLAASGATVATVDLNLDGAAETARTIQEGGGTAVPIRADVSKSTDVEQAVGRAVAELGAPAILVNNAGITAGGRLWEIADETWDRALDVNLRSCFLFCKHVTPLMIERGYGRIVAISSSSATRVGPGTSPYSASKAGIIALIKALAGEVARRGITANVVAPGLTDTPLTQREFGTSEQLRELASGGRIANPMRVVLEPEDIAAAVAFFALPESRYITGQTLHVNAGAYMP